MYYFIEFFVGLVGFIVGLTLLFFNRKAARSLVGSFFKRYYNSSMIAIILLSVSFMIEFLTAFNDSELYELIRQGIFVLAGIVFVFTSITLPKEASMYMKEREHATENPNKQ